MREWSDGAARWSPPKTWLRVPVVEAHTGGEPLRIILGGFTGVSGTTVLARRRDAHARFDSLRRALMWEPRGHRDMYGCLVLPPITAESHFSVLFTHNEGFSTMCGHGIIAVATVAVEMGLVDATTLRIDTPAGLVRAAVEVEDGRARSVAFVNVPSFVERRDARVQVGGFGSVRYDVAFGGAFYAYVDSADVGLELMPENASRIVEVGRAIKAAVREAGEPRHPVETDLGFLYGVIFTGPPHTPEADMRNVCVFADGELDRSPTGTGVAGLSALMADTGRLDQGSDLVVESILGTRFTVRWEGRESVGLHRAVVPTVTGSAHITGRGEFLLDPDDALVDGFLLR